MYTYLSPLFLFAAQIPNSRIWPVLLQLLPVLGGGVWCGASPYADGRAHGVDILAGFTLGAAVAGYFQYSYFGSLQRSFKGEDSTEIAEFLLMHSKPMNDPEVLTHAARMFSLQSSSSSSLSSVV